MLCNDCRIELLGRNTDWPRAARSREKAVNNNGRSELRIMLPLTGARAAAFRITGKQFVNSAATAAEAFAKLLFGGQLGLQLAIRELFVIRLHALPPLRIAGTRPFLPQSAP